jgi:molecular chaperone GrpE (heat shock protein)
MSNQLVPSPARWPFYLADLLLLLLAGWIIAHYPHPVPVEALALVVVCVALAAWLGVMPHRSHYQALIRFAESDELTDAVRQINTIEQAAEHIQAATAQWQGVQEQSSRTVTAAREISERMEAEAKAFAEFMQKANDQERATVRLELEKLRRSEDQSLQVLIHLLDHVFALHQAGARSGQPNLEAQLSRFQEACRDVVRRVGLTPFEAAVGDPFDAEKHQVVDGQPQPSPEAIVGQTLAAGYSFQGGLVRRSLVTLQSAETTPLSPVAEIAEPPAPETPSDLVEGIPDSATASPSEVSPEVERDEKTERQPAGELFRLDP